MRTTPLALATLLTLAAGAAIAQTPPVTSADVAGLELRGIGPALMGGRIADIAVHPHRPATWYVAVGSGGVWKTENAGTTWTPIFDDQPSYSIGCVTLDPTNPDVVWVGTGENVSGRHVGWGDGVYRSRDGGATWEPMGLERSEHVGRIAVDPRDGDVVWVAAEGPLWSDGGERGLYKTTDGGESWERVLAIDEHTGVTDVRLDPRDGDVVYAASYQRRRHVWSFLGGGPGSGIHKSENGGRTWRRLRHGLPEGDVGRIGLAVSPADADVVYATVEADEEERGFYRSTDRGESWERRNPYISGGTGPHYYQEIVASPHDVDVVYQMDVFLHRTRDGGASFEIVGDGRQKHSDNHALVIDPADPRHLIAGTDASLYVSRDEGATWRQVPNLPISQFYKLALDDSEPFYWVLGGAQDLGTLLGPSRTTHTEGVRNEDWTIPLGADGYSVAFEPGRPEIAYMEIQVGELRRYDRAARDLLDVKPMPAEGDPPERWNWDAPILVSPHAPERVYFGSQRVWRSDDRGSSWRAVSGDLTRDRNRYELEHMGRVWSVDALYDNGAMSKYATLTALSESPLEEGVLYAGSDDGLVQVSEDGRGTWRRAAAPEGVPELAFVNDVEASLHDGAVVFAALDAHKLGDYRPLLFESRDRGRSWRSIAGDLPEGALVWAVQQDHVDADLLFAGTERGVFFTPDRGGHWVRLAGAPTIAIRDLKIQRRDSDLVAASFGRGFFVLDDYAPLREIAKGALEAPAALFPVRDAWSYVPWEPGQARGIPSLGSDAFRAPNPPFGAILTYSLAEDTPTAREARRDEEKRLRENGEDVPFPGWERLAAEALERGPFVLLTVRDAEGRPVGRVRGPAAAGLHRVAWDLRRPAPDPISLETPDFRPPWVSEPIGPLAAPGRYSVELARVSASGVESLAEPQSFEVRAVPGGALADADHAATAAFQAETGDLLRRAAGAADEVRRTEERLRHVEEALAAAPDAEAELFAELDAIRARLAGLRERLVGDRIRSGLDEASSPSVLERLRRAAASWESRQPPTATQRASLAIAREGFESLVAELAALLETDLVAYEARLEEAGAPWTPGRKLGR